MKTWKGGNSDDVFFGEDDGNWFEPGYGVNLVAGGAGADTVVITGFTSIFALDSESDPQTLAAEPYSVNIISTAGGDDVVIMSRISGIDPDNPSAPAGRQLIFSGDGNDWVEISAPSAMTVFGGAGNDVILKTDLRTSYGVLAETTGLMVALGDEPPADTRQDAAWTDFDVFSCGAGNDIVKTGDGPDWVYADEGNDWIELGAGYNVAFGGDGDDTFVVSGLKAGLLTSDFSSVGVFDYSDSTDAIWGGNGNDTVTVSNVRGGDLGVTVHLEDGDDWATIETTDVSVVTGGAGNDTIFCVAAASGWSKPILYANPADLIYGDAGDDIIYAGRGADMVVGGAGHDWIMGELGDDHLYGGSGPADDGFSDRISIGDPREWYVGSPSGWSSDVVYDFQPAFRYGADAAGKADKIDVTALMKAFDDEVFGVPGAYGAANPFEAGHLRLVAAGSHTVVELNDPAAGWRTVVTLVGVSADELNTTFQADLSGGLAAAAGGDFLWYAG